MPEKEIAKDILIKMLEINAFQFELQNDNKSSEEISAANDKNVQTVCNAFKTIYQAVLNCQVHN